MVSLTCMKCWLMHSQPENPGRPVMVDGVMAGDMPGIRLGQYLRCGRECPSMLCFLIFLQSEFFHGQKEMIKGVFHRRDSSTFTENDHSGEDDEDDR